MIRTSRPLKARKDTGAEYDAQRNACTARDGNVCRFERWVTERYPLTGTTEKVWRECGRRGQDTAHILRRHACGKAYAHVDVVLKACRDCHSAFDGRTYGPDVPFVRVPESRFLKAIETIKAHSKDLSYANAASPYGSYQSLPEGFKP